MKPRAFIGPAAALLLAIGSAHAQRGSTLELNGVTLSLTSREMAVLSALRGTIDGHSVRLQDNALAAARREIESPDARYVFALYEDEIAKQRPDNILRTESLDVLIASSMTLPAQLRGYLSVRGFIAFQRRDLATADTLWTRLVSLAPNDPDALGNLAQVRAARGDSKGASALLERAIAARRATRQPPSETTVGQAMALAYQSGDRDKAIAAAHALVRDYPSPANWRDAMVVYRQTVQPQGGLEIDLMRLMRATGSLTKGNEYERMAQLLEHAGHLTEAMAVLDEGVSRSILDPLDPHTHAIAAEIDRYLQQRPPPPVTPDASPAETATHQAEALAHAGKRDEARAVFQQVAAQPGPYADLALFWIDWLAH